MPSPRGPHSPHSPRIDQPRPRHLTPAQLHDLTDLGYAEGRSFSAEVFTGDLSGTGLVECSSQEVVVDEADFSGFSCAESQFSRLHAPHLKAPRSSWRDVTIQGSRIGAAELYESGWTSVHLQDSKLDLLNLRGATLTDVLVENCSITELDLTGATAMRVQFIGCTIETLEVSQSRLSHTDLRGAEFRRVVGLEGLRGASISSSQLTELAPALAAQAGLQVL